MVSSLTKPIHFRHNFAKTAPRVNQMWLDLNSNFESQTTISKIGFECVGKYDVRDFVEEVGK